MGKAMSGKGLLPTLLVYTSCWVFPGGGAAQVDTFATLPAALISATRLRLKPPGERVENWDSTRMAAFAMYPISELLGRESGVFIKSYGLGSLATTSIRGGAAGHTAVLWNGFSISSPMLGLLDLALLPSAFFDEARLHHGGNSAAWGSGAIGGIIALDNTPTFDPGLEVQWLAAMGSFHHLHQQVTLRYSDGKLAGTTRFFFQHAANDFPYRLRADLPPRRQSHAAARQIGLSQEVYWRPNAREQLALRLWRQNAEREIPPTTVQNRSLAAQQDEVFRAALHWRRQGARLDWHARAGFFHEDIDYRDGLIGLRALSGFHTWIGELEGQWRLSKRVKIYLGNNHTLARAQADGYAEAKIERRSALFTAYRWESGRWSIQIDCRQEWVDGRAINPVAGLGLDGPLMPWLSWRASIRRNYRLPTLNDRYWRPGGNPDLAPESGWSQEAGLVAAWRKGPAHSLTLESTAFNRRTDNWILWTIRRGDPFWSAQNIAEVWSRGLEQRLRYAFRGSGYHLEFSAGHDFVRSTNQKDIDNPRIARGQQLFYTPEHQAFAALRARGKSWELAYQHRWTGAVETLSSPLPAYQLGHFQAQYHWRSTRFGIGAFFHIDNLWNENYRVIERRPMPGRHYRLGLRVNLFRAGALLVDA
jgi:vitamin B12 transporter